MLTKWSFQAHRRMLWSEMITSEFKLRERRELSVTVRNCEPLGGRAKGAQAAGLLDEVGGRQMSNSCVSHPPWLLRPPRKWDCSEWALSPFSCQQGAHENPLLPSAGVRAAGGTWAPAGDRGGQGPLREGQGEKTRESREQNAKKTRGVLINLKWEDWIPPWKYWMRKEMNRIWMEW